MSKRAGQSGQTSVFRITGARSSLTEDVRGRQRRYIISMLVRTLCVILTVVLWQVSRPLAVVTLVLGALLPYVAVVIANAGRENAPGLPDTFVRVLPRQMVGGRGAQESDADLGAGGQEGAAGPAEHDEDTP
ncbi:DUF3099 domain-containing protein [Phaeacidiphilus oryzae]|uniref:DUF3099 domain-containing protein n=1 Tax=Phaeacidiphilus oryzae TaxID=348818 RepID=UPI0005657015|nr:DUF3099 domain-containing protein [Phaeacidiphilus oryzae]